MTVCWAASLGNCGHQQSREHYLSHAIIGSGDVTISGFPLIRGETRTISGARLVAKMLCKRHNKALSSLDATAGHFFQVLKAFKHRGIMRARGAKKPGGIDMYEVDGGLIERWMLKTIVNVMFERDLTDEQKWHPPEFWIRCIFGHNAFPAGCGFYLLVGDSQSQLSDQSAIGIRILTREPVGSVIGGQFRIEDLQFVVTMEALGAEHRRQYRIAALKDKPSLDLRQIIHFRWASGVVI